MSRKAFIPGCALASYSPSNVEAMLRYLRTVYPDLSIIQKCCGKPTKAIGQETLFQDRFNGLVEDVRFCGADEVIVACQSCMKTLGESDAFSTVSLWELLPKIGLPPGAEGKAKGSGVTFSIHDSCSIRDYDGIHDGIRWILSNLGYAHTEPERTRGTTRCCGFGGMVVPVNPDVAMRVMRRRVSDFPTENIVVYCAACRQSMLKAGGRAWHILDLIFSEAVHPAASPPEDTLANPLTAWRNRYRSKKRIKSAMK